MDSCNMCNKTLNPGTVHVCKCGKLVFCSISCYRTAMMEHKRKCPAYHLKKGLKTPNLVGSGRSTVGHPNTPYLSTYVTPGILSGEKSGTRDSLGSIGHHVAGGSLQDQEIISETPDFNVPSGSAQIKGCSSKSSSAEFQPPIKGLSSCEPSLELALDSSLDATSDRSKSDVSKVRGRDKKGRFEKTDGTKHVSAASKMQNAKASRVTKIKRSIVEHMKKIQNLRPEVTQEYHFETNKKNSIKKPKVIKFVGVCQPTCTYSPDTSIDIESTPSDQDEPVPVPGHSRSFPIPDTSLAQNPKSKIRWADKSCFVCKLRLGVNHSLRIACAIKGCTRGPAHISCLNLRPPPRMIPLIRSMYRCPVHATRGKVDETASTAIEHENVNNETALVSAKKGRTKNTNFQRPKKLSDLTKQILDTDQTYQTANEIKKLLRRYMESKGMKVVSGLVHPDPQLAALVANEPFPIVKFVTLLKNSGNISD